MADPKGVLVVAEQSDGRVSSITGELLTAGRKLAQQLGEEVSAVLCSDKVGEGPGDLATLGADSVYTVEHPLLGGFQIEAHLAALQRVVQEAVPRIVLLGKTVQGRDLGPRLAFRLGAGLAQDCTELSLEPGSKALVAVRPVYGGASVARVAVRTSPSLATVRPKVFDPLPKDPARKAKVVSLSVNLEASIAATKVVDRVKREVSGVRLEDARIVVAGGRGLGGPEPFVQLEELAKLLGGAVGASRAVCDAGWLPYAYQIGLTGKTISADLYIAIGISGASQHLAGISTVKSIVAINKDASSNIFKEARFGVVGDWKKVLPAFAESVKKLMTSS